jgi:hypothetical protein
MRRVTTGAVALVLFALAGCGSLEFQEFTPAEGGFTVLMPGKPERKESFILGTKFVAYGLNVRNGGYAAGFGELRPGQPISLEGAIQNVTNQHQGKILSNKEFTLGGSTGKEFESEVTKPRGYVSGRVIVVGNRFYQVLAVGTNARLSNPDVRKFLDSFKLKQ